MREKIENLRYQDPIETVLTHEIGLLNNLSLVDDLARKCLLIKENRIYLIDSKDEQEAIDLLEEDLKKYHPVDRPQATVAVYEYGSARKNKFAFEGAHYLEQLSIAVMILTKKKCKLVYNFSYNKSENPVKFYKPFDFIENNRFENQIHYKSYLKTIYELENLNNIFGNLIALPINNGANYNRLLNAVVNTNRAQNEDWVHLKTTLFFIALESLFSDSDKTELIYKISLRASSFLYPDSKDKNKKLEIFKFLKIGYDLRSKFLHGSKVAFSDFEKKFQKNNSTYSVMFDFPEELNSIVCSILNKILMNSDLFKLFSSLDEEKMFQYFDDLVI